VLALRNCRVFVHTTLVIELSGTSCLECIVCSRFSRTSFPEFRASPAILVASVFFRSFNFCTILLHPCIRVYSIFYFILL
jgi:hypothetical protein